VIPSSEREYYRQLLLDHFREYVKGREKDVARGAETPELSALLAEKYGLGMMTAAKLLEFDSGPFMQEVDRLVLAIDPKFKENAKKRWESRPAGLSLARQSSS
jgi:hypothetical protein